MRWPFFFANFASFCIVKLALDYLGRGLSSVAFVLPLLVVSGGLNAGLRAYRRRRGLRAL